MKYKIDFKAMSDPGKKRRNNEDSFLVDDSCNLAIVADGMGGHNAGEVASAMATELTRNKFKLLVRDNVIPPRNNNKYPLKANQLAHAIELASLAIYDSSLSSGKNGMGTTLTSIAIIKNKGYFAHVGDSRGYILRDKKLIQITEDHSFVLESVRKGLLTKEEAESSPLQNILTRALGSQDIPEVDIVETELNLNDRIILCTDGLFKAVKENQMLEILLKQPDDLNACDDLIEAGNNNGGPDNITLVIGTVTRQ